MARDAEIGSSIPATTEDKQFGKRMGVLEPSDKKATTLGTSHDKNLLIKKYGKGKDGEEHNMCFVFRYQKGFLNNTLCACGSLFCKPKGKTAIW